MLLCKEATDSSLSSECASDPKSDWRFSNKCHCSKYSWKHKVEAIYYTANSKKMQFHAQQRNKNIFIFQSCYFRFWVNKFHWRVESQNKRLVAYNHKVLALNLLSQAEGTVLFFRQPGKIWTLTCNSKSLLKILFNIITSCL